jgi:hypothetical protein
MDEKMGNISASEPDILKEYRYFEISQAFDLKIGGSRIPGVLEQTNFSTNN